MTADYFFGKLNNLNMANANYIVLTTNVITRSLGFPLDPQEQKIETAARRRDLK